MKIVAETHSSAKTSTPLMIKGIKDIKYPDNFLIDMEVFLLFKL